MQRLTIDEVIEHCRRHTSHVESHIAPQILATGDISSTAMKQYWEHKQTAQWLEELKERRQKELAESCLTVGQIVYIISRNKIIPIEISGICTNKSGTFYIGINEEEYGYGSITLYPDKHCVWWYSTLTEAENALS